MTDKIVPVELHHVHPSTTNIADESTSEEIKLEPDISIHQVSSPDPPVQEVPSNPSTPAPKPLVTDAIFEASLITDQSVPDGGRQAWLAIFGCSIITFWFGGTCYSWGVIQDALVDAKLADSSVLAFVGSLPPTCIAVFAILNAKLLRTVGVRNVALLAVVLMGTGEIVSGFLVHSLPGLFVSAGFVFGYGVSCSYMVVSVLPAQYFKRRRGLANGIVLGGGGLGGAVISIAMAAIVDKMGVNWTFWLLGILIFVTGLPAAWLVRERIPIPKASMVEWRLFKDLRFMLLFLATAIMIFPLLIPPFFLPLYARSMGLSISAGAALLSAFNFASAVGRIGMGFVSDKLGAVNTLFVTIAAYAVGFLVLWLLSSSLAPLIIFSIVSGLSNGGYFAVVPTVVGNVFGSGRISVAMGMMVTGWIVGYLMGAPIAGYLLEDYGGPDNGLQAYRPAIIYAGAMAVGAGGLVAFVRFQMSRNPLQSM